MSRVVDGGVADERSDIAEGRIAKIVRPRRTFGLVAVGKIEALFERCTLDRCHL
jgi:hypothetical protein